MRRFSANSRVAHGPSVAAPPAVPWTPIGLWRGSGSDPDPADLMQIARSRWIDRAGSGVSTGRLRARIDDHSGPRGAPPR
jgi:hypothetical protein